jgi:hypothetical protein
MMKAEIVFLVGILLVAAGMTFIYWPLALMFIGMALVIAGLAEGQRRRSEGNKP